MILRKKTTFIQAISHELEKRCANLSQDYPNVMHLSMLRPSPFTFIRASLSFCSISFMLFNSFKWLLQCFILLFGHFANHGIISICVHSPFKEETSKFQSRACLFIFELNLLPKLKRIKDLKMGQDITK